MTNKCTVCGKRGKSGDGLSYHRFPNDKGKRKAWLKCLNMENASKWQYVCSEHFQPSDFRLKRPRLGILKPDAVPSLIKSNYHLKLSSELFRIKNISGNIEDSISLNASIISAASVCLQQTPFNVSPSCIRVHFESEVKIKQSPSSVSASSPRICFDSEPEVKLEQSPLSFSAGSPGICFDFEPEVKLEQSPSDFSASPPKLSFDPLPEVKLEQSPSDFSASPPKLSFDPVPEILPDYSQSIASPSSSTISAPSPKIFIDSPEEIRVKLEESPSSVPETEILPDYSMNIGSQNSSTISAPSPKYFIDSPDKIRILCDYSKHIASPSSSTISAPSPIFIDSLDKIRGETSSTDTASSPKWYYLSDLDNSLSD